MSLGMANCQMVLLSKMALTLGNRSYIVIRKGSKKDQELALNKDEQHLNILNKPRSFEDSRKKYFRCSGMGYIVKNCPTISTATIPKTPKKG